MVDDLAILRDLLESPIDALGYELVHIEFSSQGKDRVLRLYIDAPGGIRVDDCENVSRQVSAILDAETEAEAGAGTNVGATKAPVPASSLQSAYLLEVSSPGLDRPLLKPPHFQRFIGHHAKIVLNNELNGRRRFTGQLVEANERCVLLEVEGEQHELTYDAINSARLKPIF